MCRFGDVNSNSKILKDVAQYTNLTYFASINIDIAGYRRGECFYGISTALPNPGPKSCFMPTDHGSQVD
jgi:hypothetical protein